MSTETTNNDSGNTIWLIDSTDNKMYAYEGPRFATLGYYADPALYDETYTGMYRYDGTTIWIIDSNANQVYVYEGTDSDD